MRGTMICSRQYNTSAIALKEENYIIMYLHKEQFNEQGHFHVDYEDNILATESAPVSRMHWVTKLTYGMCGSGEIMTMWKHRLTIICLRCGSTQ